MSELDDPLPWDTHAYAPCYECEELTHLDEDDLCSTCAKALREEDDEGGYESSDFVDRPDPTRLQSPRDQER